MADIRQTVCRTGPAATTPDADDGSASTWAPCASAWPPATRTGSWPRRWRRWRGTEAPASTCAGWRSWSTELEAVEVVVGLPRTLADRTGPSALDAIAVADALAARIAPMPVRLADERLTTVTAQRSLREAGVRAKGQRAMIDQAAAVGILQNWLDQRRAALVSRARRGRGWLTTGVGERARTRGGRTAAAPDDARGPDPRSHAADASVAFAGGFALAMLIVVVVGAVFLGSKLWHTLFGDGQRLLRRRRQRRGHPGPRRRLHHGDRQDTAGAQGRGDRLGVRRCRRRQCGDLGDPAGLLQGAHRDPGVQCRCAACRSAEPGRASW